MAELPEGMEQDVVLRLKARDLDGLLDLLSRLILAERLQVGEAAVNALVGAAGLARSGMGEPPGPGYRPH